MALNDIIRLTFQQRQFNQLIQNVLHFRVNNILKGPADLLAQFDTFIGSEWKTHQMNSVEYVLLTAQVVLPPSEDLFSRVPTTTTAAINGASVPGQVAAVIGLRSNKANRSKNGRLFLAGCGILGISNGQMSEAQRNELAVFAGALLATFGPSQLTTDFSLVVFSRAKPATPSAPAKEASYEEVVAVRVGAIYGTQRRRRIGVGT
jgi:hypothetical protein